MAEPLDIDSLTEEEAKEKLKTIEKLTEGWSGYAWKDGEYIDDIQEYFDGNKE